LIVCAILIYDDFIQTVIRLQNVNELHTIWVVQAFEDSIETFIGYIGRLVLFEQLNNMIKKKVFAQ